MERLTEQAMLARAEAEIAWKELRSRRKTVRFSQEFLIDLIKQYGDLPPGTTVRGVQENFDTGDIVYKCLNPAWDKVGEGEVSPRLSVTFDLPVKTEVEPNGTV